MRFVYYWGFPHWEQGRIYAVQRIVTKREHEAGPDEGSARPDVVWSPLSIPGCGYLMRVRELRTGQASVRDARACLVALAAVRAGRQGAKVRELGLPRSGYDS